ncbi:nuclear transport factor 2 family protein [Acidimangrovimonas sediminis]|uniref:nuclear transport factor 2 family protein n=1 Tax=Acidimangrovimonas sediminis TaxID=2056283 RepID=UPI0011AF8912|nr:nuclear transport factor 2 family protein [Acidimangrovimonas sediminis]
MSHVTQFLDAMERKDGDALSPHLAEDVVLKSPVLVDPISGKADTVRVLKVLLGAAGTFHVRDTVELDRRVIVFLEITSGEAQIEGVDDVRLDAQGLIRSMTITWRPLPSVVLMQQKIAAALGGTPLTLAPL